MFLVPIAERNLRTAHCLSCEVQPPAVTNLNLNQSWDIDRKPRGCAYQVGSSSSPAARSPLVFICRPNRVFQPLVKICCVAVIQSHCQHQRDLRSRPKTSRWGIEHVRRLQLRLSASEAVDPSPGIVDITLADVDLFEKATTRPEHDFSPSLARHSCNLTIHGSSRRILKRWRTQR